MKLNPWSSNIRSITITSNPAFLPCLRPFDFPPGAVNRAQTSQEVYNTRYSLKPPRLPALVWSLPEARRSISDYFTYYNMERPHQSHDYRPPFEVYNNLEWGAPGFSTYILNNNPNQQQYFVLKNPGYCLDIGVHFIAPYFYPVNVGRKE